MVREETALELAGLDPENVYLLRHHDPGRLPPGRLYSAWLYEKEHFEHYQKNQKWEYRFRQGSNVASFVVAPAGETLFVGIYHVLQVSRRGDPYVDPLLGDMPAEDRSWHKWNLQIECRDTPGIWSLIGQSETTASTHTGRTSLC